MKIALLEPLRVPEARINELAQPLIDAGQEFTYYPDKTTDPNELYERSKDADIVMIANNPFPAEVIERLENTKFINVAFTGFDHVNSKASKHKGIAIANASGYATTAVAELALGLTLDLFRAITKGNDDIRNANFQGPFQGREIKGKTVGIVGTGHIGLETAKLFKAFGADLIGYNRSEKQEAKDLGVELVELDELLQSADIVSVHLPLNDETRHLLNKDKLSLMKESAVIINVARGPIIDDSALADLLNEGKIAGAGIDVFDGEPPLPADYPLLSAKNAILTPHVGFLSDEAMELRAQIAFENTKAFIDGKPQNIVQEA
ncbi:phosphoglycerate dehydrogenase-like enzyme [Aerococcus sp. 150760007-1]|uniref:Hydroxyacid dehydrogenase n=1 Tax=Aerococcus urinaeequi TaxID=51665 RepID=A0ABR5ZV53_9LACT|nr:MULTISPECIES: 2-hydroxyacid dehydrogenase [Lactobacillales]KAF3306663.1 hydroxyacid dehydrogenase [Carnobacterium sp. PL17GRE32]MBA5745604.1 hydroxyacid dehydrogenase [Aerococcus urinaeequi]MBA5828622.1 hydroxyacid dehydrogenase [Aerococcus urinaeequi]MBA5859293.1 hydroxyacid dehydrogenase [Aerococcus urinaeequi]